MKTIEQARKMFSQPDEEPTKTQPKSSEQSRVTHVHTPLGDLSSDEKMAVAMAVKRKMKWVPLGKGADAVLLFGRNKGKRVSALAQSSGGRDYLRWMSGQDFENDLMKIVRSWLART
jgi:hypothetical protein